MSGQRSYERTDRALFQRLEMDQLGSYFELIARPLPIIKNRVTAGKTCLRPQQQPRTEVLSLDGNARQTSSK